MRLLAEKFGGDAEEWGLVGLIHDADYEITKNTPEKHTLLAHGWLKSLEAEEEIQNAVLSHNYIHTGQNPPGNLMEWALYCSDELTGLIVAVALVRPEKKLEAVTVESIMKKWPEKSFAAGANRQQIAECETKLGIPLPEFIGLTLNAMRGIAGDLGL